MTASPTAVPIPPPNPADAGNSALAALFAAATANSMHRQKSTPSTSTPTTMIKKSNKTNNKNDAAAAVAAMLASFTSSSPSSSSKKQKNQETTTADKDSGAQLIASLLNSAPKHQSEQKLPSNSKPTRSSINGSAYGGSHELLKSVNTSQLTPKSTKHSSATKKAMATSPVMAATIVSPTKVTAQQTAKSTKVTSCENEPNYPVELRNLQTWHDEDEKMVDESCYQELVDLGNTNGWSADDMFKYNEKRHKITSSYDEKTLGDKYTTPLPQIKSKTTIRMATKLAKEIEDKVQLEGRITPESSDDDELFELERNRRSQLKQQKQFDQLRSLKAINSLSIHSQNGRSSNNNHNHVDLIGSSGSSDNGGGSSSGRAKSNDPRPYPNHHDKIAPSGNRRTSNKSSSRHSNSSTTPVTASLSSSPTLNDSISHNHVIKMASSSRNILRTCLT